MASTAGDGANSIKVFSQHQSDDVSADVAEVSSQRAWDLSCSVDQAHDSDVNCVRWHPVDHTLLASAGDDGLIKLWRYHQAQT